MVQYMRKHADDFRGHDPDKLQSHEWVHLPTEWIVFCNWYYQSGIYKLEADIDKCPYILENPTPQGKLRRDQQKKDKK